MKTFAIAAFAAGVLLAVCLLLTGCVVEPVPGPYGYAHPPRPYYNGWRY